MATVRPEIDLASEVLDLEDAVTAALLLVELGAHKQFEDEQQAKRAVAGTAAVLRLIEHRLRHIGRVLRREDPPATLRSPSSEAAEDSGDICIRAPRVSASAGRKT